MKNENTDKSFRVACYMRVGTKEQLSPEQRTAMFPDESKSQDNSEESSEAKRDFSLSLQR